MKQAVFRHYFSFHESQFSAYALPPLGSLGLDSQDAECVAFEHLFHFVHIEPRQIGTF
jgi:hypothetical protein